MQDRLTKLRHVALYASGARRLYNQLSFGAGAPRPHQKLQVKPSEITDRYWVHRNNGLVLRWWQSGQVLGGDWDRARQDVTKYIKHRACVAHFRDGIPWEDTGVIAFMMKRIAQEGTLDGCRTRADVQARYARLDTLWEIVKTSGTLPASPPLALNRLRTNDDILVHIDRDGQLLFGNQGFHRLAIAKLAKIAQITVNIGVVHPDALHSRAFQARVKNSQRVPIS